MTVYLKLTQEFSFSSGCWFKGKKKSINIDTKGSTQPIKNQTQNRRPRLLAKNPEINGGVSTMVEISKSIISGMVVINLLEEAAKIGIWRDVLEFIDYQLFRNKIMC